MKFIYLFIIICTPILAQKDSSVKKINPESKLFRLDSTQAKKLLAPPRKDSILPLGFDFSLNNSEEMNLLINNLLLTKAERESGLSDEELTGYMKNKAYLKSLMKLPPNEAEEYPALSVIRKILGAAKTVGVIIILLLSIL
ncbi:MAG: hypothetical protein HYZ10_15885 [Ignavibacteriales bacterium]|nr:hypothetical protein [Ignavibacteriales bacterium]